MAFQLTVPSKTFLLGEYVALEGGPVIVLATEKRFQLMATHAIDKVMNIVGIHMESPAGKFIQHYPDFYQHYHIEFLDPYKKQGGFGGSTAEFIMVSALKEYVEKKKINEVAILENYYKYAWDGTGIPPSGADLIGQIHGKVCFFHKAAKKLNTFSWPFHDIAYCLLHTGNKIATHTHLKLLPVLNVSDLAPLVEKGLTAFEKKNSHVLIETVNLYAARLLEKKLTAPETVSLLEKLKTNEHVLAAKGCGALGADVILILYANNKAKEIIPWLQENQFNVMAHGQQVANGLEIGEKSYANQD